LTPSAVVAAVATNEVVGLCIGRGVVEHTVVDGSTCFVLRVAPGQPEKFGDK
jgi:hypothetical protein